MKNNQKHLKQVEPATLKEELSQEKPQPETYELERAELFELRYLNERLGKIRMELAQADAEAKNLLQRLGVKYLENGAYRAVENLDINTGKGTRIRVG